MSQTPANTFPHHSAFPWRGSVPHLVLLEPCAQCAPRAPAWKVSRFVENRALISGPCPPYTFQCSLHGRRTWLIRTGTVLMCCSDLQGRRRFPTMSVATVATSKAITLVGWSPPPRPPLNHEICAVPPCTFPPQRGTLGDVAIFFLFLDFCLSAWSPKVAT